MHKYALIILLLLTSMIGIGYAKAPAWQIDPSASHLNFTATQNGAPVSGEFKKFSGEINFDPTNLTENNVKIVVEIGSIADAYNQLRDTLISPDWFSAKIFPQATFVSQHFVKTGPTTYLSDGTLTIRNTTKPLTIQFTQEEYTPTKARIKGTAIIKRTQFGVGQGEWADTGAIKDDVQINFIITATKK